MIPKIKLDCLYLNQNNLPITHTSEELQKVLTIVLESFESSRMNVPNMTKKRLLDYLKNDLSSRISTLPSDLTRYYLQPMIKQRQDVGAIATTEPLEKDEFTIRLMVSEDNPLNHGDELILKSDGSYVISSFVGYSGAILFFPQEGKLSHQVDVVRKVVDPHFTMDSDGDLIVPTLDKIVKFKDGKPFIVECFISTKINYISHLQGQTYVVDSKKVFLLNEKLKVTSTFKPPEDLSFGICGVGFGKEHMAAILETDSLIKKLGIYSFKEKKWSITTNFEKLGNRFSCLVRSNDIRFLNFDANNNLLIGTDNHLVIYNLEGVLLRTIVLPKDLFCYSCTIGRDGRIHVLAHDYSKSSMMIYSTL